MFLHPNNKQWITIATIMYIKPTVSNTWEILNPMNGTYTKVLYLLSLG